MWRYISFVTLAILVAGCDEQSRQGAPPRFVEILLTDEMVYEPYPSEALADPTIQAAIAECERQGYEHCREDRVPGASRTKFVREQHTEVIIYLNLGGLEADRDYDAQFRVFDPDGFVRAKISAPFHTPSGFTLDKQLNFGVHWSPENPSTWQLGRWRVEVVINGRVEVERYFDVAIGEQ